MAARCSKVLLVGHRPHVCAQVRLAIEGQADLVVTGETANYVGAVEIAAIETPDFIVVDLAEDDECAANHVPDLVRAANSVVVISDIGNEAIRDRMIRAGATDLVPLEEVVAAITRQLDRDGQDVALLTMQERAVIELVGKGLNDKEIAGRLMTSEAAVSEDLGSILRK